MAMAVVVMIVIVVVVVMVPILVMENVKCVGDDENVRMNVLGMVRIDNDHDVDKKGGFVIIFVDANSLIIIFIMVVIFLKITYTIIYVSSSLSHLLLLS